MTVEFAVPKVITRQSDLSRVAKTKPLILAPNLDTNSISPTSNSKHSTQNANKKNYVSLRKFNSSYATVGSSGSPKIPPKIQFLQQQAALADLPQNRPNIPQSPTGKHRRTSSQSKNFESRQIKEIECSDSEPTISKLMIEDTESSSSVSLTLGQEQTPEIAQIENNFSNKFLNNSNCSRKRKVINASSSLTLNDISRMNHSSLLNFNKKNRSLSGSNDSLIDDRLGSKNIKRIRSLSSKASLKSFINDLVITIQISSNWGNPNTLLLSNISVLDEIKRVIPIKTISSLPDLPDINLLEKFTDQILVKNDDEVFPIDFDFTSNEKFSFILTVDKFAEPKFVRIWNPTLKNSNLSSASAKDAEIYINHKMVGQGEIPQNFGIDLDIDNEKSQLGSLKQCNSSLLIDQIFPSTKSEENFIDQYGFYPLTKLKKMSIEVLSTHKSNQQKMELVGINGIDFYDEKGDKLTPLEFESIKAKNIIISSYANPKYIVRASMKTCCMDFQFLGNHTDQCEQEAEKSNVSNNPLFIFTFLEPTALSFIRIWNFNASDEGLENGIQKVIIRCDDKIAWAGKVKKGSGLIKGIEKSITNIWLTDSIPIREKVLAKANREIENCT